MKKRLFAILLSLAMLGQSPMAALAADAGAETPVATENVLENDSTVDQGTITILNDTESTNGDANAAAPTDINGNSYHYDQLDELGQKIYDGMVAMSKKEDFKAGTASYDLVSEGGVAASSLPSNAELNKAMYAARYAFYADHPEIFWVDFSKLAMRTTQGNDGKHVTIGSGRNANYLNEGFKNQQAVEYAVEEFNSRVNEIAEGANALTKPLNGSLQAAKVKYVHKEINENVTYRLEDFAYPGDNPGAATMKDKNGDVLNNAPLLGTPYGVLVRKQGVCEGYARAFKTVMDKLGINCILVQGAHQYSGEVAVAHMWNYVEITDSNTDGSGAAKMRAAKMRAAKTIGGKWYAVDATLDDPEIPVVKKPEGTVDEIDAECKEYENTFNLSLDQIETGLMPYGKSGFEYEKYLLAGQLTMNQEHFEAEEVAAADDYHFDYPVLEDNDFTVTDAANNLDGFIVTTKDVTDQAVGGMVTEYQFSYLGMNVTEAREKGIYLVWRYYVVDEQTGEVVPIFNKYGSWNYLDPNVYSLDETPSDPEKGTPGYTSIRENRAPYVEIAATTVPPEKNSSKPFAELTYQGDDSGLIARTGKIANPNQNDYQAPPFIKRQTPTATACINVSNRYFHITVEYDEALKIKEGKEGNETKITCRDRIGSNVTGAEYSDIKNFRWDGDRTVEFDMKFSTMFADDNVIYRIYLEGLVGKESNKAPNPIVYAAAQGTACPCVMASRADWDIFGKPTLLASDDLSTKGWTMSNGQAVSERLKDRLTLVTTKTTAAQEKQMNEALKNNASIDETKIQSSATYNITLSVCKSVVIPNGHKVQVRLGFPDGYGPDDEGVTFKAYHFKRDNQGNVTGVEEIPCVITQYGLILTCDAFSPFTVAAVEEDPTTAQSTSKTLVVTTSDGGAATSEDWDKDESGNASYGMVTMSENDSKTLTFTPNEGYQIESITVCGETKEVTAGTDGSAAVTVSYNDIKDAANNIINANFVAKAVAQAEVEAGQTVVEPTVPAVTVTIPLEKSCGANGTLSIVPDGITEVTDGVQTYQWYKGESKLEGKVNRVLEIQDVSDADAGEYSLEVTTTVGTLSRTDRSEACAVTITECQHINQTTTAAKDATCKEQGNEEYTTCDDCGALVSGSQKPLKTIAHTYEQDATADHLKSAATCSKSAVYYESCSMCHENGTATFMAGELEEHNYAETVADNHLKSAATCQSKAVYYKSCSMCGQDKATETFTYGEVDSNNHQFDTYNPTDADASLKVSDATCTAPAVYYEKCSRCGAKGTETFTYGEVDLTHHVGETVLKNKKEATATEDGYTGDKCCASCDTVLERGSTIPATGETQPVSQDPEVTVANGGMITKVNGIAVAEDVTKGNYPLNTVLTVEANTPVGNKFAGWFKDEECISYSETYQFYVKGDLSIEAKFVDESVQVTPEPTVVFMNSDRSEDETTGKQTVKLGISVEVPGDYSVVSEGIVRSYRRPDLEASDPNNTGLEIGKTGVTNNASKTVFTKGSYTYSFTIAKTSVNRTKTVYARGYVKYKNETTGDIDIKYTDIVSLTP